MLVRLLYASRAAKPQTAKTIAAILAECQRNNPRRGITGVLCYSDDIFLQVLEGGRIAMAAMGVGIAQAALDQAVKYMKQRTAFGRTLAEFNGLQGMIAEVATEVEVARLLTLRAACLKDFGEPAMHAAAMAKVFASETAMWVATKGIQLHGSNGYSKEYAAERYFRDAKITEIYEGTSEIQRLVISREITR